MGEGKEIEMGQTTNKTRTKKQVKHQEQQLKLTTKTTLPLLMQTTKINVNIVFALF